MSKETETVITVGLILFAILAWLWPLLAAIQIEEEDRKRRNEPPQYDERQRMPFIFSCVYAVVLTGVVIYKVKRRKKAEIEDAP